MPLEPAVASTNAYADAKANSRDTVKWLAAAFAAMATVVVAGSSLSGIGQLNPGWRLTLAAAALLIGFVCVIRALYVLFQLLRADGLFASDLARATPDSDTEIGQIVAVIHEHRSDLLPYGFDDFHAVWEQGEKLKAQMSALRSGPEFDVYAGYLAQLELRIYRLLDFALYIRMSKRLESSQRPLFVLGGIALVSLALFAYAANPPKATSSQPTVFVMEREEGRAQPPLRLAPVRFASGSATISPEGRAAVADARDIVRKNGESVLLLRAHFDAVTGQTIERNLTRRRIEEIRRLLLLGNEGLSPTQIFVAELPSKVPTSVANSGSDATMYHSVDLVLARPAQSDN